MNKKHTTQKFGTDFERLRNMKDEDIDYSDIPKTTPEMWAKGFVKNRKFDKGETESVEVAKEIIEFFKKQEGDYTENINRLLRNYVETQMIKKV